MFISPLDLLARKGVRINNHKCGLGTLSFLFHSNLAVTLFSLKMHLTVTILYRIF